MKPTTRCRKPSCYLMAVPDEGGRDPKNDEDDKSGSEYCPSEASDVEEETMVTTKRKTNILLMDCTEPTEPTAFTVALDKAPKRMKQMLKKGIKSGDTSFTVSMTDSDTFADSGLVESKDDTEEEEEEDVKEATDEAIAFLEDAVKGRDKATFPCKHHALIVMTE